jgi:hypothetical protein
MSVRSTFLVQTSHPATFLERGVALPFTTPVLSGTRVRPGERGGPELVVPNPAGGQGQYILPWSALSEFCQPTVHDARLTQRVAALRVVTPATIRDTARLVAAEGLAGAEARLAAGLASQGEQQARLMTNFRLLLALVRQVEPRGENPTPPEREQPAVLEARAKRAIARLAPSLGLKPDRVAELLEELATIFAGIGIGDGVRAARLERSLADLRQLQAALAEWAAPVSEQEAAIAVQTAKIAGITIRCTELTLAEARAQVDNLPGLLARWRTAPEATARLLTRPEWLLDGWEQASLLWRCDDSEGGRRRALAEISQIVPALPNEAGDWAGFIVQPEELPRLRRTVVLGEDWRTGATLIELIARNEAMLAAMAA